MSKEERRELLQSYVERMLQTYDYDLEEILERGDITKEECLFYLLSAGLIDVPEVLEL